MSEQPKNEDFNTSERFRRLIQPAGEPNQEDFSTDIIPGHAAQFENQQVDSQNGSPVDPGISTPGNVSAGIQHELDDTAPIHATRPVRTPQPFGGKPLDKGGETHLSQASPRFLTPDDAKEQETRRQVYQARPPVPVTPPQSSLISHGGPNPPYPKTNQAGQVNQPVNQQSFTTKKRKPKMASGCLAQTILTTIFIAIIVTLFGVSFAFYQYYRIASQLPDIQDLRTRASQFETTRILDRNGNILYEILDPNAGRRTYVPLSKISPYIVAATIATEDKEFYNHPGFDLMAIIRAFIQNYQGGETVSGASTITQQLARTLLFTPEERVEQSYNRKMREAILAAEITRRYSKDEILELYLNEIYFSNLAYGVQAAAETYFRTSAQNLTLGQAAFLAGLPQAPGVYDVFSNPEATFSRMEDVLVLMFQASQEKGCIYVSNSPQPVCVDVVSVTQASQEIKNYQFPSPDVQMRYPHWVTYVRSLLETQYDAQTIYRSGFTVYTTLDPTIQEIAERAIQEQVAKMADQNAKNGAVVAIKPNTGEILAMVGSVDFQNEAISGQVNMAVSPRQPGSAIKPLTYLAAFEKGWTPATLLWDVPSEFSPSGLPNDPSEPYIPVNYDGRFHGPVTVRSALANSFNIPAVKALEFVGVNDDPNTPEGEGLVGFARRMGITTLNRSDYGLSLTLGGGEVSLLELTRAFATLANDGVSQPSIAITRVLDYEGNVVFEQTLQAGQQVVRQEHAYLISSILSDNKARTPAFGSDSVLRLSFPAAVKTGTTNDFRDNWTVGYNPDLAIGVWVGNADYTPMKNTSGLQGAAPVWAKVMEQVVPSISGGNPARFETPGNVVERTICKVSGAEPSKWCPEQIVEIFVADQPPLPKDQDLWQEVLIDTWTGLRASAACADFTKEQFVINITDQWAKKWVRKDPQGQAWADKMGFKTPFYFTPSRECRLDDPRPILGIAAPRDGETISSNPLMIYAVVDATQHYESFRLEYGLGEKPSKWKVLTEGGYRLKNPEILYEWDLTEVQDGPVTLRLTIESTQNTYAEVEIRLNLQVPTPTPTSTLTPTVTSTMLPTFTPQPTFTATSTQAPLPTATQPFFPPFWPTATPQPATATPTETVPALPGLTATPSDGG